MVNFLPRLVMMSLALLMTCAAAYGQDIIIKKSGEEVVAKVVRVDTDTIHYRMLSDTNGPMHFVLRQDVAQLQLATAPTQKQLTQLPQVTDEYASASASAGTVAANTANYNAAEMMLKGRQDAVMYYKGQGAMWGTAGATFLFPPAGLVTGIIVAAVPPNVYTTYNPNIQLMQDPTYREAFQKQAHRRKVGKAATGIGVGFGSLLALALMLSAQ
ncbi:hypothetical protein [Pontibacter roseus]|uniref:hypothetical protein n=1 Tax=Pontibacter roseus TaxID=336989 RepID=UPI0012FA4BB1|nr:hypothetical protein [Pontibacter roseus]